jgi:hypothetical protein
MAGCAAFSMHKEYIKQFSEEHPPIGGEEGGEEGMRLRIAG